MLHNRKCELVLQFRIDLLEVTNVSFSSRLLPPPPLVVLVQFHLLALAETRLSASVAPLRLARLAGVSLSSFLHNAVVVCCRGNPTQEGRVDGVGVSERR